MFSSRIAARHLNVTRYSSHVSSFHSSALRFELSNKNETEIVKTSSDSTIVTIQTLLQELSTKPKLPRRSLTHAANLMQSPEDLSTFNDILSLFQKKHTDPTEDTIKTLMRKCKYWERPDLIHSLLEKPRIQLFTTACSIVSLMRTYEAQNEITKALEASQYVQKLKIEPTIQFRKDVLR